MSNVSVLGSYNTNTSTDVGSVLSSNLKKKTKDDYSEDKVTLSQEAQELVDELRYKKNLKYITTVNEASFDRVSKSLPATEGFNDMLTWLSQYEKATSSSSMSMKKKEEEEIDRNVYQKDPKKYAEMWDNMYKHYTDTMKDLGLDKDSAMQREVLSDETVSVQLMYRFASSFSSETKNLLNFFNINVTA